MELSPIASNGRQFIQSYNDGKFQISEQQFEGSVIVFPEKTIEWDVSNYQLVTIKNLMCVTKSYNDIDLLLIGCGSRFVPRPDNLYSKLKEISIILEWMDTGAACRTFNVLLSEERRVAAALIAT